MSAAVRPRTARKLAGEMSTPGYQGRGRRSANSAAARTSAPIFGCSGTTVGWMPLATSASVMMGPTDATISSRNAVRTSSSRPLHPNPVATPQINRNDGYPPLPRRKE